jgi:L-erythro-3,5-diaminohexanoate dehydrogenase
MSAARVDGTSERKHPWEVVLEVEYLLLDSTSARNLHENYGSNPDQRIYEIISTRGKMHNPDTNSGGVLIGRLHSLGERAKEWFPNTEQQHDAPSPIVSPLVSLSCIPLDIVFVGSEPREINPQQDLKMEGEKVIFPNPSEVKCLATLLPCHRVLVNPPPSLPLLTVLAAMDISSLVPQTYRLLDQLVTSQSVEPFCVYLIGCGKSSITCQAAIRHWEAQKRAQSSSIPPIKIFVSDVNERALEEARSCGWVDATEVVDSTNVISTLQFISKHIPSGGADLVVK